jgi:hypothetical protein
VSDLQTELGLPSNQVLALFNKAIRKLHGHLRAVKEAAVDRQLPRPAPRAAPAAAAAAGGCTAGACVTSAADPFSRLFNALHNLLGGSLDFKRFGTTCRLLIACRLPVSCLYPCPCVFMQLLRLFCPGVSGPLLGEGVTVGLDEELDEAARQEREKMRAAFRPEDLAQYAIKGERDAPPDRHGRKPFVRLLRAYHTPTHAAPCLPQTVVCCLSC